MQRVIIWFTVENYNRASSGCFRKMFVFIMFFSTSDSWSMVPLEWEDLRNTRRDQCNESPEADAKAYVAWN